MTDPKAIGCLTCGHPLIVLQMSGAELLIDSGRHLSLRENDTRAVMIRCSNPDDAHTATEWQLPIDQAVTIDAINDALTLAGLQA